MLPVSKQPPPLKPGKYFATGFALIVLLLFMVLIYWISERDIQQRYNPNQNITTDKNAVLTLQVADDGHFRVSGTINGKNVVFLLDTGASSIAVSQRLAKHIGLPFGAARQITTANGNVVARRTVIDELVFGGWHFHQIPAVILPEMDDEVLLGMSVLHRLHWQQNRGTLQLSPSSG